MVLDLIVVKFLDVYFVKPIYIFGGVGGSLDYPGTFTTLTTPSGKYLFTLALEMAFLLARRSAGAGPATGNTMRDGSGTQA